MSGVLVGLSAVVIATCCFLTVLWAGVRLIIGALCSCALWWWARRVARRYPPDVVGPLVAEVREEIRRFMDLRLW